MEDNQTEMRSIIIVILISFWGGLHVSSQNFNQQYEQFRSQAQRSYDDFRNEANLQYGEFLKTAWRKYNAEPVVARPKDENVPPVVIPKEDANIPIKESRPVPIDIVVEPPVLKPQPMPVSPIREIPKPEVNLVAFSFYGTDCKVRFNEGNKFSLGNCSNAVLAEVWQRLAGEEYNNLINDCLKLRIAMRLCDWAYLNMLSCMARACLGDTNEATFLTAYVYCQSGYMMRIGRTDGRLVLLYGSEHRIYGKVYYVIDGVNYYAFNSDVTRMEICDVEYPCEQSLSLQIPQAQKFEHRMSELRFLQSERYPELKANIGVNRNMIDFYNDFPSSEVNDDFMTRWAMYANTPMDDEVGAKLYPVIREQTEGMSKKDVAERLLNFVQTAFVYEYDDKIWGHDRAFFAEETFYYPYCEDRSILFSRMVRDLLGLDVLLVYYPGHLATAVCFAENVAGDYIEINGRRFTICDPTYIGAGVGRTMPTMDNAKAKVILLAK